MKSRETPDLWVWTGTAGLPQQPPAGSTAVAVEGGRVRSVQQGTIPAGTRAVIATDGAAVAAGGWAFAGRVRGRSVLEYRSPAGQPEVVAGPGEALAAAAAFLGDRAGEAATVQPWWGAWRQAAAALCEIYEGCGFELAWTDGGVVVVLVQRSVLVLAEDGTLGPGGPVGTSRAPDSFPPAGAGAPAAAAVAATGTGAVLARGRAELGRLGLYAGGRCLAVAPITGAA